MEGSENNKSQISHTPLILALALLIATVGILWKMGGDDKMPTPQPTTTDKAAAVSKNADETRENSTEPVTDSTDSKAEDELLGVWVPYMSLSVDPSQENFENNFDNIVKTAKEHKMKALIVHVRPFGDSMYLSDYFPYSHILTGTQGQDPGFDAMEYMLSKTHEEGLEFHAWINPLRIKVNETPRELSQYSPYTIWQDDGDEENDRYTMEYEGGIYLNPAYPEVRQYIISSIEELLSRYEVDGIQFDDYFYPDASLEYDSTEYEAYKSSLSDGQEAMNQLEWRRNNINSLISGVYSCIKAQSSDTVFGISPQGNIENNLDIGADVYSWGSVSGYCDYLCPQIYFSEGNEALSYSECADDWKELVTNEDVKLYIGLGLYKAGSDEDEGSWLDSDENMKSQIEYGRKLGADGFMFYSYDYLVNEQTEEEVENVMNYLGS